MTFSIQAAPTFKSTVLFPIAGAPSVPVVLEFKHVTRDELAALMVPNKKKPKSDAEVFQEVVVGWDLSDPYTPENVTTLLDNHQGVAVATWNEYHHQLTKAA